MTEKTTVYDRHFEDHLLNHGVFLPLSTYPEGTEPPEPENLAEFQRRLQAPRPSRVLSPDSLKKKYKEFTRVNSRAIDEQLVIKDILPLLEGKPTASSFPAGGHRFTNLAPLTDGTLANAKPDFYYGARSNQLEPAVRQELNDQIIPSTQGNRPVAPNFFVEVKGHYGPAPVAMRQACYGGALGVRALHSLQLFGHGKGNPGDCRPTYDNKAYTMMWQWALLGDPETYQRGVTAYHTARDMAQEFRDRLIQQANARYTAGQRPPVPWISTRTTTEASDEPSTRPRDLW